MAVLLNKDNKETVLEMILRRQKEGKETEPIGKGDFVKILSSQPEEVTELELRLIATIGGLIAAGRIKL